MAKLSPENQKKFLHEKLEEQRHLLRKSVDELANGDLAEGVRIATTVRVLVHESGSSKPLLKQLTPNYLELPVFAAIRRIVILYHRACEKQLLCLSRWR
jgi:hypothetical protein